MNDKILMLSKGRNIALIPNWIMLNNAIRSGNLQVLAKLLKQAKDSNPPLKPNAFSFIFAIWSGNPQMLDEVMKFAKKKHGIDFIPDFNSLAYGVLGGNLAMVDKLLEIAIVRKYELFANFELLNYAAWSNNPAMITKVLSIPMQSGTKTFTNPEDILTRGQNLKLHQDVLDAIALSGNPSFIHKMIAVAQKYQLNPPAPSAKTLNNAIKSGNYIMVQEVLKLAAELDVTIKIDNELFRATEWSDNPGMKSYIERLIGNN